MLTASLKVLSRSLLLLAVVAAAAPARAHDLEKTHVILTLERDGSFTIDVKNEPSWLKLRLESVPGPFVDRIVMWVDGREIRPTSSEYIAGPELATHRLKGQLPLDAKSLRWYYGLVIDPYPLTIHRADGRIVVEEIQGDAWSRAIDVGGEFSAPTRWPAWIVVGLFVATIGVRITTARPRPRTRSRSTLGEAAARSAKP